MEIFLMIYTALMVTWIFFKLALNKVTNNSKILFVS